MKRDANDILREKGPDVLREAFDRASAKQVGNSGRPVRPATGMEALQTMIFAPIKYVVPDILVEGLTLLGGKPKVGKRWLLLHAAVAVARGGFTLGELHCIEGECFIAR